MTKRQKLYALIPIFLVAVLFNKCYIQQPIQDTQIEGTRVIEVITQRVKQGIAGAGRTPEPNLSPDGPGPQRPAVHVYVPPEGKVIIKNGKVKFKDFGFTFHPGMDYGLAGNGKLSVGLDAKIVYAWRFGLNVGVVGLTKIDYISPAAGVSYSLAGHSFLLNTELDFKYAPRYYVPVWVGLRWNF
jgi:hypothetical protein